MRIRHSAWHWLAGCAVVWLCLAVGAPARAQDVDDPALAPIERAFSTGNARELMDVADDHLEVGLFGESTLYSRSQAMYVLDQFFSQYRPQRFAFTRVTRSSGGLFASGSYRSRAAAGPFQVYVQLRQRNKSWEVREVRIERPPHD